jgi:hypothetical protein
VYMDPKKFGEHCVPRFRKLFNRFEDHAMRMRNCGVKEMVALAAAFDAENNAKKASVAIETMLTSLKSHVEV